MLKADVLIIGSEGAGAMAAVEAKKLGLNPMILTKGRIGKSGATCTAGADINCDSYSIKHLLGLDGDERDTKEQFFTDTVVEGRYLNNQKMVEYHVEMIPDILKDMIDNWGMKVTRKTCFPAGHTYGRGVMTQGVEIMRAMAKKVHDMNIPVYEHFYATDHTINDCIYQ